MSDSNSAPIGEPETSSRDRLVAPILACGALVALAVTQLVLPLGSTPPDAGGLAARRPRPVQAPQLPATPDILRAPIFAPDRSPVQADTGAKGSNGSLDAYSVLGAAVGRTSASVVLFGPGDPGPVVLKRGELVKGWRLMAVDGAKATFERDGVKRSLAVGAPPAVKAAPQDEPEGDSQ